MRRAALAAALAAGLTGGAAGCGSSGTSTPTVQNLDRPVDITFGCYGLLRLTGGDPVADPDDELDFTPQPLGACKTWASGPSTRGDRAPEMAPPGQEGLDGQPYTGGTMRWLSFALQSASGTVAVIEGDVKAKDQGYLDGELAVLDGDPLSPGKNALSVGSLPVAIATDAAGCHVVTANAGSCDLSIIDVDRVVERSTDPLVRRQGIATPSGAPLLARPAAMIAERGDRTIGVACPEEPTGLIYVAYPDCHAVAVVHAGTGEVMSSIRFADDGTASIGDGELSCPAQCGDPDAIVDGARPITLDLVRDDVNALRRLAIGLDNRPVLTVVDLDSQYLPLTTPGAIEQFDLEGDVGLIDLAISPIIGMTGEDGWNEDVNARPAEFVYAVATDGSIRVVEVSDLDTECDTQVDPRYLVDENNPADLLCQPVGMVGTPPRRALAWGPGIQLPGNDAPLSVVMIDAGVGQVTGPSPHPDTLIGHFALVTSTAGHVYVINIDDDNYPDTVKASRPLSSDLSLGLPHQLRDALTSRGFLSDSNGDGTGDPICNFDGTDPTANGPRTAGSPVLSVNEDFIASEKAYALPYIRQLSCIDGDSVESPVSELRMSAPVPVRTQAYPDWASLGFQQRWTISWEGTLSRDGSSDAVDGPVVRTGQVRSEGGALYVDDPGRPYCAAGVEPYDVVTLRGCDPSFGDGQCGLNQTCYVHPDSTDGAGTCLDRDQVDGLGGACRDFLISLRRFSVQQSTAGELVLSERRRVLRTTPIDGCTSTQQCTDLAAYDAQLTSPLDPQDETPPVVERTYACEPDPTRAPGKNRCVMTCQSASDCDEGTVCSGGYCLEGVMPPPACLAGLQRYDLRAGESFVVIGERAGYVHSTIEEPGTGRCVKDTTAHPLLVGRIPLDPPACSGDGLTDFAPNPCRTTVDHTEVVPHYVPGTCETSVPNDPSWEPTMVITRSTEAIRFRNPGMTFHLVDPTFPGDGQCLEDRGGSRVGIPTVYPGFSIQFQQIAGFLAFRASALRSIFPINMVKSPDDAVWIIDEGDIQPSIGGVNSRGQIIRLDRESVINAVVVR